MIVAAHRLAKLRESASIRPDDPRFGLMIQCLAVPGENLKEIAEEIARSTTCALPPQLFAQRLENIIAKIRTSGQLQLEEELGELLCFAPRTRDRELAAAYLGWDGMGTHTLEEVALRYGMTRERVRQITQRLVETVKAKRPFLPVLERVLQAITGEIPCPVEGIESLLAERKLGRERFRFGGVITALEITGRPCLFAIEDADGKQYVVPRDQQGVAKTLLQLKEHGPVMQRPKLEERCLANGLQRDTFYIHLTYSPVIARYAPGVYGLRGAQVPPGLAESMKKCRFLVSTTRAGEASYLRP